MFETAAEFEASKWPQYFDNVYGNHPTDDADFPLDLNDLWVFYSNYLDEIGVKLAGADSAKICPKKLNEAFTDMSDAHDPPDTVWLYKPPPYKALESNTWVEFTHCADAVAVNEEAVGSWMYHAPGSGDYFNLGKTIAFDDHDDAVKRFLPGVECDPKVQNECSNNFKDLFPAAIKEGYDSIQFLCHADERCGNTAVEIVDLNGVGNYACQAKNPGGSDWKYKTGWNASLGCKCENSSKPATEPPSAEDCFRCKAESGSETPAA